MKPYFRFSLLLAIVSFGCNSVPEPRLVQIADYFPETDTTIQTNLLPFSDTKAWKTTGWTEATGTSLPEWITENGTAATTFAQGNAHIHLEMKLEKGSTFTVLLQNAYPLVLHGDPTVEGQGSVAGIAASAKASLLPGLWQTLDIVFYAPGANVPARLFRATLNGVEIHSQVQLPAPEKSSDGFLVLTAEGKATVRNIALTPLDLETSVPALILGKTLRYEAYEKDGFQLLANFAASKKVNTGETAFMDIDANRPREINYGLKYFGTFTAPQTGEYKFLLTSDDGSRMYLDGKEIITNDGAHGDETRDATLTVEAGEHAFEVDYFQGEGGASLRMDYTGNGLPMLPFFSAGKTSVIQSKDAYNLVPEKEPIIQRSFLVFPPAQELASDEDPKRRTHGISVGDPSGNHFALDAGQGTLLMLWHGAFANAFNMWDGRGNWQNLVPMGQVISRNGQPDFAVLAEETANWPDSLAFNTVWKPKGYELNPAGWPVFDYELEGVAIKDQYQSTGDALVRTTTLTAKEQPVYFLIASGESVDPQGKGRYVVQGPGYFVQINTCKGAELLLRQTARGQELVAKIKPGKAEISTALTW